MQIQGQYVESGAQVYASQAAEEIATLKVGAGKLFALIITNFNAASRYVYIFDTTTVGTGIHIAAPIPLTASGLAGSMSAILLPFAVPFIQGLIVACSSTGPTYTAAGTPDLRISALYK